MAGGCAWDTYLISHFATYGIQVIKKTKLASTRESLILWIHFVFSNA